MAKKVLITSGPTRIPLDAVRLLTNRSTGLFGTLLAREALQKKWKVTFICGEGSLRPKPHRLLRCIDVETNDDVARVLKKELTTKKQDVVIHAMAVLDFQPLRFKKIKTKTRRGIWNLKLVQTPKIINQIKKWSPHSCLVGFKLEVGLSEAQLLKEARRLLHQAKADFVLANQLSEGKDATHLGLLLNRDGQVIAKKRGKANLARLIFRELEKQL